MKSERRTITRQAITRRAVGLLLLGSVALSWNAVPASAAAAPAGTPGGAFDSIGRVPGGIRATGWALDRDTPDPIAVHLYDNGKPVVATTAEVARPDVGASAPGFGENHGFDVTFDALEGTHTICAYAINVGPGANSLLGCRPIAFSHRPQGSIDAFTRGLGGLHVAGWAVDPDSAAPVEIRAYSGADFVTSVVANGSRSDIATALPSYGPDHGFDITFAIPSGVTRVCLHAIDDSGQANGLIGCGQISSEAGLRGALDSVSAVEGGARVAGWALDLDVVDPVSVHLYLDGRFLAVVQAAASRADIGRLYTGFGDEHGLDTTFSLPTGTHRVCAYAINAGPGSGNLTLGCRDVTVA